MTERHGGEEVRCLFCLRADGPFTSEEHIIPEGIGNTEFILPTGVVCDGCNNGPLSTADQAFLNFMPVALMRAARGVPTKSGGLPDVKFGNATLRHASPENIELHVHSANSLRPIPGGVEADLRGRHMTPKYTAQVTRFLFKAALEFIYLDLGVVEAFSAKYDEVRRIALGAPYAGFLLLPKTTSTHDSVSFTHYPFLLDGRDAVWAHVDAFGVFMGTELLVREAPSVPNDDVVVVIPF